MSLFNSKSLIDLYDIQIEKISAQMEILKQQKKCLERKRNITREAFSRLNEGVFIEHFEKTPLYLKRFEDFSLIKIEAQIST